jgi:hypothetical protein
VGHATLLIFPIPISTIIISPFLRLSNISFCLLYIPLSLFSLCHTHFTFSILPHLQHCESCCVCSVNIQRCLGAFRTGYSCQGPSLDHSEHLPVYRCSPLIVSLLVSPSQSSPCHLPPSPSFPCPNPHILHPHPHIPILLIHIPILLTPFPFPALPISILISPSPTLISPSLYSTTPPSPCSPSSCSHGKYNGN